MRTLRNMIAAALVAVALIGSTGPSSAGSGALRRVPKCPEDAVLIGRGEFESGRWDRYACGPARDDYRGRIGR